MLALSSASPPYACVVDVHSCVVALETSCGRAGVVEWDVEGREPSRPNCGRGGSGGGVPSLDGSDSALADGLRERLWMMFSVGLVKAGGVCCRCAASSPAADLGDPWLLCCVGVVAAFPVSSIKAVVTWPGN